MARKKTVSADDDGLDYITVVLSKTARADLDVAKGGTPLSEYVRTLITGHLKDKSVRRRIRKARAVAAPQEEAPEQ